MSTKGPDAEVRYGLSSEGRVLVFISGLFLSLALLNVVNWGAEVQIAISFTLASILIVNWLLLRLRIYVLENLRIDRRFQNMVFENERIEVELNIVNETAYGLPHVLLNDEYPPTTKLVKGSTNVVASIPPKSRVTVKYVLEVDGVGKHEFNGVHIRYYDLLGLYVVDCKFKGVKKDSIRCMPQVPNVDVEELVNRGYKILGTSARVYGVGYSLEFKDVREYMPGDEIKRIEWKSSSRLGKLMVKDYEPEVRSDVVIMLDLSENMFLGPLGNRKIDYSARAIAFTLGYLLKRRDRVGFVLISKDPVILPLETTTHATLTKIMDVLSDIAVKEDRFEEIHVDYVDIYRALGVKDKTLFLVISDLEDISRARSLLDFLATLRAMRHEVMVISPITALFEMPLVSGLEAAIYRIETHRLLNERRSIEEFVVRYGIPLVNVGPYDLIPVALARLEDYRRRVRP